MATDMAKIKSFTDVSERIKITTDQKAPAQRQPSRPSDQAEEYFPTFKSFDLRGMARDGHGGSPRQLEKSGPASLANTTYKTIQEPGIV